MTMGLKETVRQWLTPREEPWEGTEVPTESIDAAADTKPANGTEKPAEVYGLMRLLRKGFVLIVGLTVVTVGVIMIVTPGPAVVVIPLGLGILATEFLWARRLLNVLRKRLLKSYEQLGGRPAQTDSPETPASPKA